jgi:threonine/homoserine/homoserine lactone efflux protein
MNEVESEIVNVLRQGVSLRARAIASVLGVSLRDANHYLYTSLQALVTQDQQYRWMLKHP